MEASGEKGWNEFDSTTGSLYYSYHNLKQKDLDFFKSLSYFDELKFEHLPAITICHGSPRKANEKLLPNNENTYSIMENNENTYILCGHTHVQGIIEHKGKIVLNAGSVGVPLYSKGKAQFMILHGIDSIWNHEFISLEYDVEEVIKELTASGLAEKAPWWCKVSEHLLGEGSLRVFQ